MRTKPVTLLFLLLLTGATVFVACGGDPNTGSNGDSSSSGSSQTTATPSRPTETPVPSPTPEPVLKHPDLVLDLKQGDFWEFRWEYTDQSCAQGSGCSTGEESGSYRVSLGEPRTISDIEMFAVEVSGSRRADDGSVDLGTNWKFIGSSGTQIVASDGFSVVTIFDALDGEWVGGGFFSRFSNSETHATSLSTVQSQPFASWPGVQGGSLISVVRSDSETLCEIIEGRRICPRDESFSISESQFYQNGVGPMGYSYRLSASFSGGGFFSSSSSEETVALVASSLRGDVIVPTPTSPPRQLPPRLGGATPTPEIDLDVYFGPHDGSLTLVNINDAIPDFETGVDLSVGVVDVTFVNPDVGGGSWSYGITFRHSEEETFHVVYVTSNGQWEHFSRGGSPGSQVSHGSGTLTLNTGAGAENRLFIVFNVDEGAFFVNSQLVSELDLLTSNARASGDVRVMAGILSTDTYNGSESEFLDLVVLAP